MGARTAWRRMIPAGAVPLRINWGTGCLERDDACVSFSISAKDAHLRDPSPSITDVKGIISEIEANTARVQTLARRLTEISMTPDDDLKAGFATWVAAEYARRRKREAFFPADVLLGEPGWDLLLDLAIQRCNSKHISITSACIAARVPNTTALRWIAILEQQGLVERSMDAIDRRRTLVAISDLGFNQLLDYYKSLSRPQFRVPASIA